MRRSSVFLNIGRVNLNGQHELFGVVETNTRLTGGGREAAGG